MASIERSFKETERKDIGEVGGGIATALGIRARGVFRDPEDRILLGVGKLPQPARPFRPDFGVANGELMEVVLRRSREGADNDLVGLSISKERRDGLPIAVLRELSCFAVIDMYLEALDPGVNFSVVGTGTSGLTEVNLARGRRPRAAGVVPGVTRPVEREGVVRPVFEGVTRPLDDDSDVRGPTFDEDAEGVIRPESAGVVHLPRDEATEEGRGTAPIPTVGAESLVTETKTPQCSGHEKYRTLW